jgi:hypothetical protein
MVIQIKIVLERGALEHVVVEGIYGIKGMDI